MRHVLTSVRIAAFLLVGLAVVNFGQVAVGSVRGTLVDPTGAVIPDTRVSLYKIGDRANVVASVKSNDDGSFVFESISPGAYLLRATLFGTDFEKAIRLKPGDREKPMIFELKFGSAACQVAPGVRHPAMTDSDKAEIVRHALRQATAGSKEVISTKNISAGWLDTSLLKIFSPMTHDEIQKRADTTGDFMYWRFSQLRVKGQCVVVSLDNLWAVGKKSQMGYVSGGGQTYEYRKVDGKWIGKPIIGWIS
ncbi:MAG TPA: carboxypeptidase-like regulatory domain-containing protein [Pyrinomonadaceae bacterium]|nr:carboxypeptidase-like regulatory domain-containing protein [Pyrinomonadaceae bacterium]